MHTPYLIWNKNRPPYQALISYRTMARPIMLIFLFTLKVILFSACGDPSAPSAKRCSSHDDCSVNEMCINGTCLSKIIGETEEPDGGDTELTDEPDGGTDADQENTPPSLTITTPQGKQSGQVDISFSAIDGEYNDINLEVEFSIDQGKNYSKATQLPQPSTILLDAVSASPKGEKHIFVWHSNADLPTFSGNVKIRMTPVDAVYPGVKGKDAISDTFQLDNLHLSPPQIESISVPETGSGDISIEFTIKDSEADKASVIPQVDLGNGRFIHMTIKDGPRENLDTSKTGIKHKFIWNSLDDTGEGLFKVKIQIIPADINPGIAKISRQFTVDNRPLSSPPEVTLLTPKGEQGGFIKIEYSIKDLQSDKISIKGEFCLPKSTSCSLATHTSVTKVKDLASDPAGVKHFFVWRSLHDLGKVKISGIRFKITPSDAHQGNPAVTMPFDIDNQGNIPPSATVNTPSGVQYQKVKISFNLSDPEYDPARIEVHYSIDNGITFQTAFLDKISKTNDLPTSPQGRVHEVVWEASKNLEKKLYPQVKIKISPFDLKSGSPAESSAFTVDNRDNTPPEINISPLSGVQSKQVEIKISLQDQDKDPVNIDLFFSRDGKLFSPATSAQPFSTRQVATSPTGKSYTFIWDSEKDLGQKNVTGVIFRVSVDDGRNMVTKDSPPFEVNNLPEVVNQRPSVEVETPAGFQTQEVPLTVTIFDPENDSVDLKVEYSLDSGNTYNLAAMKESLKGLVALAQGKEHLFHWQAGQDMPDKLEENVKVRVTPIDTAAGAAAESGEFTVDTRDDLPPEITIEPLVGTQKGQVEIKFILKSNRSLPLDTSFSFSTDGQLFLATSTSSSFPDNPLASLVQGKNYIYFWDSLADLGKIMTENLLFRIKVESGKHQVIATSAPFTVDNRPDGGTGPDTNHKPVATVKTPAGAAKGRVELEVNISDQEGDMVDLQVEYSLDQGNSFEEAVMDSSDQMTGLSTSSKGSKYFLHWLSQVDIPNRLENLVRIRVTPSDIETGVSGETADFIVDNTIYTTNQAPQIVFTNSFSQVQKGEIPFDFILKDKESDPVDVTFFYSTDNIDFIGAVTSRAFAKNPLESSPTGKRYSFIWDSRGDLGNVKENWIIFRVIAHDGHSEIKEHFTPFAIDNSTGGSGVENKAPAASIATPQGDQRGNVVLSVSLSDPEGDLVDISKVEFSIDGGILYSKATVSSELIGLEATLEGTVHTILWHSQVDIPSARVDKVKVRIYPDDGQEGFFGETEEFVVDNRPTINSAPEIIFTPALEGVKKGNIDVVFSLQDSEKDNVELRFYYSTDGTDFYSATLSGDFPENPISTQNISQQYIFTWSSASDLGYIKQEGVVFRIAANDGVNQINIDSQTFVVDNSAGPGGSDNEKAVALISTPEDTQTGEVSLQIRLSDSEEDVVDLQVEYSIDSGASYQPASMSTSLNSFVTNSEGIVHTVKWLSQVDIVRQQADTVRIKVTPFDNKAGVAGETADFEVDNREIFDTPPQLEIFSDFSQTQKGDIPINFGIKDDEASPVEARFFFSTDGVTFYPASTARSFPSNPLPTSVAGEKYIYYWNSSQDLGEIKAENVVFKIQVSDSLIQMERETAPFIVDNSPAGEGPDNEKPVAIIKSPVGVQKSEIGLQVVITDAEEDLVDLTVEYSIDSGATYLAASMLASPLGLESSANGTRHVITWLSAVDIVNQNQKTVRVKVTPADSQMGTAAETTDFEVDNLDITLENPLKLSILPLDGEQKGEIQVEFIIKHEESKGVNVSFHFSDDQTLYQSAATARDFPPFPLATSPEGIKYTFTWDSRTDIGAVKKENMVFRIIASDGENEDTVHTMSFTVNNDQGTSGENQKPVVIVATPAGIQHGPVQLEITVSDQEEDLVDLKVKFSLDGGQTYSDATVSEALNSLVTSKDGYLHKLTWSSDTDIVDQLARNVRVKVIPADGQEGIFGETADFQVDNRFVINSPPRVAIYPLQGMNTGPVRINFEVKDYENSMVNLKFFYSTNGGGLFNTASEVAGAVDFSKAVASSVDGINYTFTWDSLTDLGKTRHDGVIFRIEASDFDEGEPAFSEPFVLDNVDGNAPPMVVVLGVDEMQGEGVVPVEYIVADRESDYVDIQVEYSLDGGQNYSPANFIDPDRMAITEFGNIPEKHILDIPASPVGNTYFFGWHAIRDLGRVDIEEVHFRITPKDEQQGTPGEIKFVINLKDVFTEPLIEFELLPALVGQQVQVNYTLKDNSGDLVNLDVYYSPDQGETLTSITPGQGGDGLSNLPASLEGVSHSLVWDSVADLGINRISNMTLVAIPSDAQGSGQKTATSIFNLDNTINSLPVLTIELVEGIQSFDIEIGYKVVDLEGELVSVKVEYSTDNGQSYQVATPSPDSTKTKDIASSPVGEEYKFIWRSHDDLADSFQGEAIIRMTPSDEQQGAAVDSESFVVDNRPNTPPEVIITTPIGVLRDRVDIVFYLKDQESSFVNIDAFYSLDGGVSYFEASSKDGKVTSLASSSAGISHVFQWDSLKDMGENLSEVIFKIIPRDAALGQETVSENFTVNNRINTTPSITIEPISGLQKEDVNFGFSVFDGQSDELSWQITYSLGGTTFKSAAQDTQIRLPAKLPSAPTGVNMIFVWNSRADLGEQLYQGVRLCIQVEDLVSQAFNCTVPFTVDNRLNNPPQVIVTTPTSPQRGLVNINFQVKDQEADKVDLAMFFAFTDEPDSSAPFFTAHQAKSSPPLKSLTTSIAGVNHQYVWNSFHDLRQEKYQHVRFKIVAFDGKEYGQAAFSGKFTVDNAGGNTAPQLTLIYIPTSPVSGNVGFKFKLEDSEYSPTEVTVEVKEENGTFQPATLAPESKSMKELSSAPEPDGVEHIFSWNSVADFGLQGPKKIKFRFTPKDSLLGTSVVTSLMEVDNRQLSPPVVTIQTPAGRQSNQVEINFTLKDGQSHSAFILPQFSIDGGVSYMAATPVDGSEDAYVDQGRLTSPLGIEYVFKWNSSQDVVNKLVDKVYFRITPSDAESAGEPVITGEFQLDNRKPNTRPRVAVFTPATIQRDKVEIAYFLIDDDDDICSVTVDVSIDGINFVPATRIVGQGDDLDNLETSKDGKMYSFVWDSMADLGAKEERQVVIKMEASDSARGEPRQTAAFAVDNRANKPPTVIIDPPLTGIFSGDIEVKYLIKDETSNLAAITAEVKSNDFDYQQCTSAADSGPVVQLESSAEGIEHNFTWDSHGQVNGKRDENIIFRLQAKDFASQFDPLRSDLTGPFIVDNSGTNTPPEVIIISSFSDVQDGNVTFKYKLKDAQSDPLSVKVEFRIETETDYSLASVAPGQEQQSAVTNLTSSPQGEEHTFVWNSLQDLGLIGRTGVYLQITPTDIVDGSSSESELFFIDNSGLATPVIQVENLFGKQRGKVKIDYNLKEKSSTRADIFVEYSLDGQTYFPAAMAEECEGNSELATSAEGVKHNFIWDSFVDLEYRHFNSVTLRLTPFTKEATGLAVTLAPFELDNINTPPQVVIKGPVGELKGRIKFEYTVIDAESDPVNLAVSFVTMPVNEGDDFSGLTLADDSPKIEGVASSPQGKDHHFIWNSKKDIDGFEFKVMIKIKPNDEAEGKEVLSDEFDIDNRNPRVSVASVTAPTGLTSGNIEINFTLTAPEATSSSIEVYYIYDEKDGTIEIDNDGGEVPDSVLQDAGVGEQPDGGETNAKTRVLATVVNEAQTVFNLTATPGGSLHTVKWDSAKDFPDTCYTDVQIEIVPFNPAFGDSGASNLFTVNNSREACK